jgi:arginine decarboxylase
MHFVPTKGFLTRGVGRHKEKLTSFEMALRDAGIEKCNLVRVSSIFPPHGKLVTRQEGVQLLQPGQVVFAVLAEMSTNEPSRMVAASIGLAIPADPNHYGYISEHHAYGQKEEIAGDYAEDLAASMLATTLGVSFDPNLAWDERRAVYLMSGDIVKTRNMTQTAECGPDGLWTTVVAACVYVEYNHVNDAPPPAPGKP